MRKGTRSQKICERVRRINVAISRVRYRVERTFGSIRGGFMGGTAGYVGLAKMYAQLIMETVAYNLYRTPGIIVLNAQK